MLIFTIGILALAGLQMVYIGDNAAARMQTEAVASATAILEQLRMLPLDHEDLDPARNPHRLPAKGSGAYRVEWMVTDNDPVINSRTVRITVTPRQRLNGRSVVLSTVIAE